MKKIILFLLILISGFTILSVDTKAYANEATTVANFIPDKKIDIVLVKDGNKVTINHTSGYNISHAVTEYVRVENGINVSRLETFGVNNNTFNVPSGTTAVKVHQIKTLIDRVYYTYATSNQNSVGSFSNVVRKNVAEIETKHVEVVKTEYRAQDNNRSPNFRYFEFYFQFDKEHDFLVSVDVDYIIKKYILWGTIETDKYNVTENIDTGIKKIRAYRAKSSVMGNVLYEAVNVDIKGLERNTTNHPGNYVVRVAPSELKFFETSYQIENFAIIRIEYSIDGEFIIDEVINDPVTPEQEQINWLLKFIEDLQNGISKISDFFSSSSSTIIKVAVGIGILLLLSILSPVFKLLYFALKSLYNLITGAIASILGIFFR